MSMVACTVFTTALCNLNCNYCYICKDVNGGLAQIDKDIEESFKSKEYIKNILAFGESIDTTLQTVCLWGGEPFLHMERFTSQIQDWFQAFPNLDSFNTSTNFTVNDEIEKLHELLEAINKYGPKSFYRFDLQISIDGYPEMNDNGRGIGVTERILKNFNKLLKMPYNRKKIQLYVTIKPTLSKSTMHFLDTVEKCHKWASFFNESMYLPVKENNFPFLFELALFNCATPTEWTKEDGILFANIVNNLDQLNPADYEGWKNFHSLIPMAERIIGSYFDGQDITTPRCGGACGAYVSDIVPIPNGKYSVCHRGLFDNYVDYCNVTNNIEYMNGLSKSYFSPKDRTKWVLSLDELKKMHHTMSAINTCPSTFLYTDYVIFIREYARQGIIDKKYFDIKEINLTLPYYLNGSYCMQDGFVQNGSWTTIATYEIPLMYNGAMDIAVKASQKIINGVEGVLI